MHADHSQIIVLWLSVILLVAKFGGHLAVRLGQPSVLGELGAGVLLGNLSLFGFGGLEGIKTDSYIALLSELGVILLLFEVGLESTVAQMLQVGWSSFLVASLGVVAPFVLGFGVSAWLLADASTHVHMFLGATLTATSVGITARVLQDLKRSQSSEARVILGAAVIDDVLGLVVLAVVVGMLNAANNGHALSYTSIGITLAKALGFLVVALSIGRWLSPRVLGLAAKLRAQGTLLAVGLAFCFGLAWLASAIDLAPIVGAFAAGLVLESVHYRDFTDRGESGLEELVKPIASFLVPVFFVRMGMLTDLRSFSDTRTLVLALALTLAAIVGKQLCYFGVLGRGIDRLTVGIGMIPRGEVGLIFANIGLTLSVAGVSVIDRSTYSAVVVMVIITTLVTPPALKWSFGRLPNTHA